MSYATKVRAEMKEKKHGLQILRESIPDARERRILVADLCTEDPSARYAILESHSYTEEETTAILLWIESICRDVEARSGP